MYGVLSLNKLTSYLNNRGPVQAPALPGAQPISEDDRIYTADMDSNTVSVINPKKGVVLGTIPFGSIRMDTGTDLLGAMYDGEMNVHGLGFSRDGRYLNVICVTSNSVHVVETATNKILNTIYVGRAPHEGFFSPDGCYLWVAERGQDTIAVIDWRNCKIKDHIVSEDGPSKVVFSPDGRLAYVNHLHADVLDIIDVETRQIINRVKIPLEACGSSDAAISPDGKEIWLGMLENGKTTVISTKDFRVQGVLGTGPRTNHPNFVTVEGVNYAYLTVGDLNQTLVYRRAFFESGHPTLVKRIQNHGAGPHGIWPSPDNTRMYVALQYSDAVDVIDTKSMEVINTMRVGQSPMALVYVARDREGSCDNLTRQGLDRRVELFPIEVLGFTGGGTAQVREMPGLDEVVINLRGLPPNKTVTVYALRQQEEMAILTATSNEVGTIPEALAFVHFFKNRFSKVLLR